MSLYSNFKDRIAWMRRRRDMRETLRRLYATPDGKAFLDQLFRDTGVTRPRVSKDPYEIAFNEGKRHVGMSYLQLLTSEDPSHLISKMESDPSSKPNEE